MNKRHTGDVAHDWLSLSIMLIVMCVVVVMILSSCTIRTKPAQQQNFSTSSETPVITVAQLDQDQDGQISTAEAQQLITSNSNHVVVFLSIVCCVIVVCVVCAMVGHAVKRRNMDEN